MLKYRVEIDGLRAIAVLLVVLFHLSMTRAGIGGYIGVDVFFVISGYLITDHLRRDLRDSFRGIIEFYRRRVIRIFPALFVVYLACVVCELAFMFPIQLQPFQHALVSSVFFSSNFYLYETVGYFDFRARSNPLIHTWSLSIEEQFYILLPFLLFLFRKQTARTQIAWLGLFTLISLFASQYFLSVDARISFYLVPLRAWELLAGSLLSYVPPLSFRGRRWVAEIAGAAGVAMIVYSACTLTAQSSFPGFAALVPVIGAALLLVFTNGERSLTQRALALPPMRFIGQISYSLYLWHWPLIVYARYVHPLETNTDKIVLILLSILLSAASWRWIEQPIRRRSRMVSARTALLWAGGAMVATSTIALALPWIHSALWRTDPRANAAITAMNGYNARDHWRDGRCFLANEAQVGGHFAVECLTIDPERANVLLLGDSHAAMLWEGLKQQFPQVNFLQATAGSCPPFNHFSSQACKVLMDGVIDDYLSAHPVDVVIVSAQWLPTDAGALAPLMKRLKGKAERVIVFGPNASFVLPFPEVVARVTYRGNSSALRAYEEKGTPELDRLLEEAAAKAGAQYISVYRTMCTPKCAVLSPDGVPATFDYDHLSGAGSLILAKRLPPNIFAKSPRRPLDPASN